VGEPSAVAFLEDVLRAPNAPCPKTAASWITNHLFAALAGRGLALAPYFSRPLVSAAQFGELVALVDAKRANLATGKKVLEVMLDDALAACAADSTGNVPARSAEAIVAAHGWAAVRDAGVLRAVADAAVRDPSRAKDLAAWAAAAGQSGDAAGGDPKRAAKLAKFFLGAAMRDSKGRASPQELAAAVQAALLATLDDEGG